MTMAKLTVNYLFIEISINIVLYLAQDRLVVLVLGGTDMFEFQGAIYWKHIFDVAARSIGFTKPREKQAATQQ